MLVLEPAFVHPLEALEKRPVELVQTVYLELLVIVEAMPVAPVTLLTHVEELDD